jgi:hypothetical protein
MRDFTLDAYRRYLEVISDVYSHILRFDEFFLSDPRPDSFCILRHDVDRRPGNALKMAALERQMGVKASYYFRATAGVFIRPIIEAIAGLDHEIGYHYECLSEARGNPVRALDCFKKNLERFRRIAPIKTISMHGRPLSPYDNRDLWRDARNHSLLVKEYGILGEIYLDIDYSTIAYINDTGRNWSATKSNVRDRVTTNVHFDLRNSKDLMKCLGRRACPRLVFQTHPERWNEQVAPFVLSLLTDLTVNTAKLFMKTTRNSR